MIEITHLKPPEAAKYIGRKVQTLANWRKLGIELEYTKGPGKNGRILYAIADLDAWLAKNKRKSTAEDIYDQGAGAAADVDDIYG